MADDFRAEVMSLGEFFVGRGRPLIIPDLQRSFEWGTQEIDALWKDIQFHQSSPNLDEIFLGTLIVFSDGNKSDQSIPFDIKEEEIEEWMEKLQVYPTGNTDGDIEAIQKKRTRSELLDGQQRLTTLLIGIKIIAKWCKTKRLTDHMELLESYLMYFDHIRLEHQIYEEQCDFRNIIENHGNKDKLEKGWADSEEKKEGSFSPMRKAYLRSQEILEPICGGRGGKARTEELVNFIQCDVKLCVLECASNEQKHLVFAAVNNAGITLHQYQLFKSKIYHRAALHANETNYNTIRAKWNGISKKLWLTNHMKVGDFLFDWARSRNFRMKKKDGGYQKLDKKNWYNTLADELLDNIETEASVLELMDELEKDAETWIKLRKVDSTLGNHWYDLADFHSIYSNGGLRPVLLSILNLENENEKTECVGLLRLCTAFIVIPGFETKATFAAKTVDEWIPLIREGKISELKKKVRSYFVGDKKYGELKGTNATKKNMIYGTWAKEMQEKEVGQPSAKFLLRYIESLNVKDGSPEVLGEYNTGFLNAEHIFPKSAPWEGATPSQWKIESDNNSGLWPDGSNERRELKWRLGNFIILEKPVNISAGTRTWRGSDQNNLARPKWKKKSKGSDEPKLYPVPETEITVKKLASGCGKGHVLRHFEWVYDGVKLKGSQLEAVNAFEKEHARELHWSQALIESRTEKLTHKVKECKKLKLNLLWP